ncbi:MAG: hypothetical protein R3Y54_02330 [Eubacteriales bacterium]
MTFAQETVYDKSNEIPTVQNLIKTLKLKGCVIVADALNCQKDTAKAIVEQEANVQKVLNMIRKIELNSMRSYKDKTKSKRLFSNKTCFILLLLD